MCYAVVVPGARMKFESFRPHFHGEILTPESPEYDGARRIWNGMIDRRPRAIARCTGPADVQAAVRFAVDNNVYPATHGGGHNVAGLSMVDDGFVIDVAPMKGIYTSQKTRVAVAQTGLTWGEFDRETHLYGLATTGGLISTTGIAGLTLGGGVGWLMGRCGLVCDNTISYDVVLASGDLVRATADEHPELFWGLKGGGGNFGVVTSIGYQMHPIATVIAGMVLHPLSKAREVLRFYRDFVTSGLPDELIVYAASLSTPDGQAVVALMPTWCGDDLSEGERVLQPLRKFGTPIADAISTMPYPALQTMLDAAAPFGNRNYWKSRFLGSFPDDAIDRFIEFANMRTSPRSIVVVEHSHGAVTRVAADATPFPNRDESFDLVVMSAWTNRDEDERHIEWTRAFYAGMAPWAAGSVYVNALDQDDASRVGEAYGKNYARLCAVKAAYDPENRFRRNQNIQARTQTATS